MKQKIIASLLGIAFLALAVSAVVTSQGCASARIRPAAGKASREVTMEVTAYCNCGKCCSWRRNWYGRPVYTSGPNKGKKKAIGMTASGRRAGWGTIAADPQYYPFGTVMYVPGYGYARVEDTGGAIKGDHIDIWFPSHVRAHAWVKRKLQVKVWK